MTVDTRPTHRVLLLMSPSTYRAGAFMQAARDLGLTVARGVDLPPELAEEWRIPDGLALDFRDGPASARAIAAYHTVSPLTAILSVDDSATVLAAEVSAALNLPHNAPDAALAARDKSIMRERLAAGGVPVPAFRRYPLAEDAEQVAAEARYPCVVKPLLLSGSRGVIRANTPAEMVAAVTRLRRYLLGMGYPLDNSHFLVEEFVPGVEVALEGLLTGGDLHPLALFDKPDPLDGPFFEETIYVTPSRLPEATQAAIVARAAQAAVALGLREGPVHAELRVNEAGPWLIEAAGRSIGGQCSSILRFGADVCLEELILRHAVGLPLPDLQREASAAGAMMIPIPGAGLLQAVQGVEEARATPHVTGVEITAPLRHSLVPLPEGGSYLGFIFARADDPATVEAALRQAHAQLRFVIRPELPVLAGKRR